MRMDGRNLSGCMHLYALSKDAYVVALKTYGWSRIFLDSLDFRGCIDYIKAMRLSYGMHILRPSGRADGMHGVECAWVCKHHIIWKHKIHLQGNACPGPLVRAKARYAWGGVCMRMDG